LAILLFLPLLLFISVIIKLTSAGPIFFRQERLGQHGRIFEIVKFRTMSVHKEHDPQLTSFDDPRITQFGQLLRLSKIDELPQLWNVIIGEMSLVGPRPEVPKFARLFPSEFERILMVKPGITGLASIIFRDEALHFQDTINLEQKYESTILPIKLKINKYYIQNIGLWLDFRIFIQTFLTIFHLNQDEGIFSLDYHLKPNKESSVEHNKRSH